MATLYEEQSTAIKVRCVSGSQPFSPVTGRSSSAGFKTYGSTYCSICQDSTTIQENPISTGKCKWAKTSLAKFTGFEKVFSNTTRNIQFSNVGVYLFLTWSSLLLLQDNGDLHDGMDPLFGKGLYNRIRESNLRVYSALYGPTGYPNESSQSSMNICHKVYDKMIDCNTGAERILHISNTMEDLYT